MKFTEFYSLAESLASLPLEPEKHDPNDPQSVVRRKLADRDDAPRQQVARVLGKVAQGREQRIRAAQKVATAGSGVRFGDTQDPVDAASDKAAGRLLFRQQQQDKYNDRVNQIDKTLSASKRKAEIEKIKKEFGGDPNDDATDTDAQFKKRSAAERMATSVAALQRTGRGSRESEAYGALRDTRIRAERQNMRDPIQMGGRTIYDRMGTVHATQGDPDTIPKLLDIDPNSASGDDLMDREDNIDEFVNRLYNLNQDEQKRTQRGTTPSGKDKGLNQGVDALVNKSGVDATTTRTPTETDLNLTQGLTPESQTPYQQEFRAALDRMDGPALQKMMFVNPNVSDEVLDRYIDLYGRSKGQQGKEGKQKLLAAIESRGLDGDRYHAAYGGDIFGDGEVPDEVKPKKRVNGKLVIDEDAPPGVYDWKALKAYDKANKTDYYNQAAMNRGREMVRTYLKQGGRDGYAVDENRAMTDMDLEHLIPLNADAEAGQEGGGGYDHPDNYAWTSGHINKIRGAEPATKRTEKFVSGKPGLGDINLTKMRHSFDSVFKGLSDDQKKNIQDNAKTLSFSKTGKLQASKDRYLNRTPEDIEHDRKLLKKNGMSDEDIAQFTQDTQKDPQTQVIGVRGKIPGSSERIVGTPFLTNPDQYRQDVRTQRADERVFNDKIGQIQQETGARTEDEALATPEGQAFERKMARWGAQVPREEDKPKAKKDSVVPKDQLDISTDQESAVDDLF